MPMFAKLKVLARTHSKTEIINIAIRWLLTRGQIGLYLFKFLSRTAHREYRTDTA